VNIPWEIYKGRLLDASQTRERRTFEAWNIYSIDEFGRSTEPLLSVKLDAETGEIHVVRAILCYAWEAYESSANVIESRETTKWVRELVGTLNPVSSGLKHYLMQELGHLIFLAVVGLSRLPLTSVEAPLPAYSLGRLAYFSRLEDTDPTCKSVRTWTELTQMMHQSLPHSEQRKLLESFLHAVPSSELRRASEIWIDRFSAVESQRANWLVDQLTQGNSRVLEHFRERAAAPAKLASHDLGYLLVMLFNDASLTPYTDMVGKAIEFMECLEEQGRFRTENTADCLGYLLRQLGRHLTAYDLVTFHHRGANYPDALVLDALLKSFLRLIERKPELFARESTDSLQESNGKRYRRSALRQAWLLRRRYEGHLVPDAPTSAGENWRVLPPPHIRVPEEQILNSNCRTKRLYNGDSLDQYLTDRVRLTLAQSIEDLYQYPTELRELGMALFLDRPFGGAKTATETDNTLLVSYWAFSRSIASERLDQLEKRLDFIPRTKLEELRTALRALDVPGITVKTGPGNYGPGIVSLADALRVAEDFLVLRSTERSWIELRQQYHFPLISKRFSLKDLNLAKPLLILRTTPSESPNERVTIFDYKFRERLEFSFDPRDGYLHHLGVEVPASPLRLLRVWEESDTPAQLREHDLSVEPILLQPPRW
jgi:hypothetical protein